MKHIIFALLDTPAYGGAETYLCGVLSDLQKKGYSVVLATNNSVVRELWQDTIDIIKLPYRLDMIGNWKGLVKFFIFAPGAIVWLSLTLKEICKKYQIHMNQVVCVFPGYSDRLLFSPIVRLFGASLFWLEFGPLEPTFSRNFSIPKYFYFFSKRFVQRVITISEWTKKSLIGTGKIDPKIIILCPPALNWPKKIPITKKRSGLIALARLAKEKEIDLLLKAFQGVQSGEHLTIVGDGPEMKYLKKLARTLGISQRVHFAGFVSEKEKAMLLQESLIFVFPSAWDLEGFGMTTIEAVAAGALVISSGSGPQGEIIQNNHSGIIFSPHTPQALTAAIEKALLVVENGILQKRAFESCSVRFSKDSQHTQLEKLFP